MSISSSNRKAGPYTGNGSTTGFPFSFKVFQASDILVVRTDTLGAESNLVLGTDYTVALNVDQDANPGGTVTLTTVPAAGYLVTITSQVQNLQPVTLTNQGGFYPKVINDAFDRLTILVQQAVETISRSLRMAISAPSNVNPQLPSPTPYSLIGWNGAGTGFQNTDPTYSTVLATDLASTAAGKGAALVGFIAPDGTGKTVADISSTASGKGSALVGFIQSGAGAVARTADAKLRDSISVKDFGAVGDGVIDDTAAIQAALNAADSAQMSLLIPGTPNGYKITAPLVINSTGLSVVGDGEQVTKLIASGNFSEILKFNASTLYATVSGITFISGLTTTRCVTIAQGATVIRFSQCYFSGGLSGDLLYSNGQNIDISESTFQLDSVNTWACNFDCYNQNCGVTDCRIGGIGNGIRITNAFSPANRVEGLRIADSYFINTGPYNISLDACVYTSITGCVLDQASTAAVYLNTGASDIIIDSNYIGRSGTGTTSGVNIQPSAGGNCAISNNVFDSMTYGISIAATAANRVSNISITGNQFTSVGNDCLLLDSVLKCVISNNVDAGPSSGGSWATLGTFGNGSYTFDNNHWHTAAPGLFHSTSAYRFGNDTGIVGRNRGNSIPGAAVTSLVIPHGLFTIPTTVNFTIEGANLGNTWITAKDTTSFTANWVTSSTPIINWTAEV